MVAGWIIINTPPWLLAASQKPHHLDYHPACTQLLRTPKTKTGRARSQQLNHTQTNRSLRNKLLQMQKHVSLLNGSLGVMVHTPQPCLSSKVKQIPARTDPFQLFFRPHPSLTQSKQWYLIPPLTQSKQWYLIQLLTCQI